MNRERTMLICDDEVELVEELAEYFCSFGWKVDMACTAQDAIERIQRRSPPRVLLTDLRLGLDDGRTVVCSARAVCSQRSACLVIIVTGHVMHNVGAADLGSDLLCVKPINPDQLRADIDIFLLSQA